MTPIIVCIKVGTKYDATYVNRLAFHVEQHTTVPHEFLCLTYDPVGVLCPTAPIDTDLPGWWSKLVLFKPHWALKDRRVVFLDLDTVIVGNIDFLLEYDGPFCILRDFYRPETYGSAVMSFAPGCEEIWDTFQQDVMRTMHGDQDWLLQCIDPSLADRWQDLYPGKIVSYKVHCSQGIPEGARVICFHGSPRPHEVTHLTWMQEHWHDRCPVA